VHVTCKGFKADAHAVVRGGVPALQAHAHTQLMAGHISLSSECPFLPQDCCSHRAHQHGRCVDSAEELAEGALYIKTKVWRTPMMLPEASVPELVSVSASLCFQVLRGPRGKATSFCYNCQCKTKRLQCKLQKLTSGICVWGRTD